VTYLLRGLFCFLSAAVSPVASAAGGKTACTVPGVWDTTWALSYTTPNTYQPGPYPNPASFTIPLPRLSIKKDINKEGHL
jgi:hypothetical protein